MNIEKVYNLFPTKVHCVQFLEKLSWKNKPVCPYCNNSRSTAMAKESRHHCNYCHTTFSVTVNTPFHHSRLPLQKWFLAIFLVFNDEQKFSVRHLAHQLKVSKNTAWFLIIRIQQAILDVKHRRLLNDIANLMGE